MRHTRVFASLLFYGHYDPVPQCNSSYLFFMIITGGKWPVAGRQLRVDSGGWQMVIKLKKDCRERFHTADNTIAYWTTKTFEMYVSKMITILLQNETSVDLYSADVYSSWSL